MHLEWSVARGMCGLLCANLSSGCSQLKRHGSPRWSRWGPAHKEFSSETAACQGAHLAQVNRRTGLQVQWHTRVARSKQVHDGKGRKENSGTERTIRATCRHQDQPAPRRSRPRSLQKQQRLGTGGVLVRNYELHESGVVAGLSRMLHLQKEGRRAWMDALPCAEKMLYSNAKV